MASNPVKRGLRFIERRSKVSVAIGCILLAAFVGWLDKITGLEVSIALLYLVPVGLTAWFVGRGMGLIVSVQCAAEGFIAGMSGYSVYSYAAIPYWNAAMMLGYYVAVTLLLSALKSSRSHEENLARRIQEKFLPSTLELSPAVTIASAWKPSVHVGGDYFDAISLGPDRIGVCIADVTGHGIPAALLMSNVQSAVRLLAPDNLSPANLCARLNQQAVASFPDADLLTFFFGVLHLPSGLFSYSNAGHNPPIVVRRDGTREFLQVGGVPIGILPSWSYREETVRLNSGDTMLLYTDGVTESRSISGEFFGEQRMIDVLVRNRARGPKKIIESIVDSVQAFSLDVVEDDITLLCIALNESPGNSGSRGEPSAAVAFRR